MDLDVPPTPAPPAPTYRTTQSLDEIALSDDLGLIEASGGESVEDLGIDLNAESLTIDDDEESEPMPTPSIARRSTMVALHSVEILQASVEAFFSLLVITG